MTPETLSLVQDIISDAPSSISDIADHALVPQGIEIPKPEVIFALNDVPLFTKKSISTLTGKAKAGKTTCSAWMVAQIITQGLKVVWFDTEQGLYYASRTQHWVLQIAGRIVSPDLKFYDLKVHGPAERAKIIDYVISQDQPDIIVIDGIRDLVFDINSPEEATLMVGKLMRWAEEYDCHIMTILHMNKSSETMRGHLGTEMTNKSETVLSVDKDKDDENITICKAEYTRGLCFAPFAFQRDDRGIPVIIDLFRQRVSTGEANSKKMVPVDIHGDVHTEILKVAFGDDSKLSYSEFQVAICAAFEQYGIAMGIVKSKTFIQFYLQNGYVVKENKTSNKTFYALKV